MDDYVTIYKEDFFHLNSKGIGNGKVIALYCKIKAMSERKGFCEASNAYFADFLSCSTRQIPRYLTELEQAELITIRFRRNGKYLDYREIIPTHDKVVMGYDKVVMGYDNIGNGNQDCHTSIQGDKSGNGNQDCHTSNISAGSVSPKENIFNIIKEHNLNKNLIKNMILLLNQNVEDINKNEKVSGNYNFSEEEFKLLQKLAREGEL